jgi:hypothetical protein
MWIFLLQDEMSDENWQLICRLKKQLGIPWILWKIFIISFPFWVQRPVIYLNFLFLCFDCAWRQLVFFYIYFRIVHGDSLWVITCVVRRPFSVIFWISWNKKYMVDMLKLLKVPLVVRTVLINWTSVQSGYNEFSICIKSFPMPCWSHENCNSDDEHRQHGRE